MGFMQTGSNAFGRTLSQSLGLVSIQEHLMFYLFILTWNLLHPTETCRWGSQPPASSSCWAMPRTPGPGVGCWPAGWSVPHPGLQWCCCTSPSPCCCAAPCSVACHPMKLSIVEEQKRNVEGGDVWMVYYQLVSTWSAASEMMIQSVFGEGRVKMYFWGIPFENVEQYIVEICMEMPSIKTRESSTSSALWMSGMLNVSYE